MKDVTYFEDERNFEEARAQDPSRYYYYGAEFGTGKRLGSNIVYLCTPKKAPDTMIVYNGRKFLLFETKKDLTSALKNIEAFASGDAPISETGDATDATSTAEPESTVEPSTLAPSNAVDTPSESSLPINHNLESVCEFFVSEEEFIEATVKACTNDGFFYAHRCVKIEKAVKFCDKIEFLHIKVSEHEALSSGLLFDGKNGELFFSHESVGMYILFHHKKDAQSYLDKRAQAYPATVVSESEFLALCPQIKAVGEDPKRSTEAMASMVKPATLEEKRAELAQRQPEQRRRYTSWHLTPQSTILGFIARARQEALNVSGLILPPHLTIDNMEHQYALTEHDKEKGRADGNTSNKGSYKFIRDTDGSVRLLWNTYNGKGGCYSIKQYIKEEPSQELTDNQWRAIQERAEKRRIAYERKAQIIEEQAKKYRAEWMQRYNTADGSIQDCLYLKKKGFNLADIESVLDNADVKYDRDGTLCIPYKHSDPKYNNTYAGHQAINPSHKIAKSFGKGADCGRDGNFIWIMFTSDTGSRVTYLCEGIATSLSVLLATRANVINCFNAGGLVKVSRGIKDKKFPIPLDLNQVFICADNDIREDNKPNTGLEAAIKASQILGCRYFLPESGGRKCDFDDLRTRHGIEEVRAQLQEERAITPDTGSQESTAAEKATIALRRAVADIPADFQITADMLKQAKENGDRGLGVFFSQVFHDKHLHDKYESQWYIWNKHYWIPDTDKQVLVNLEYIREILREDAKACYELESQEIEKEEAVLRSLTDDRNKLEFDPLQEGESEASRKRSKAGIDLKVCEQNRKLEALQKARDRKYATSIKYAETINSMGHSHAILESASSGTGSLSYSGKNWDDCVGRLPVQNGVIDLKTGELSPGKQEDYIKTACPLEYDPKAQCPLFLETLWDIFEDKEVIDYLKRVMGYTITGLALEDKFFMWVGLGSNGKSTLFTVFNNVLGDGISRIVKPELFLETGRDRNANEADPAIIELKGCRLALCAETGQGKSLNAAKIKNTSGRDALTGRIPYAKSNITFKITHTTILATNFLPHCTATDPALWRRIVAFPFRFSFKADPVLPNDKPIIAGRENALKKEYTGILRWLVEGAMDYLKEGLPKPPESIRSYTEQYRQDEDTIGQFIQEVFIKTVGACDLKTSLVYPLYTAWCRANGTKAMSKSSLFKNLREYYGFIKKHKEIGDVFLDLRVNAVAEQGLLSTVPYLSEEQGVSEPPF